MTPAGFPHSEIPGSVLVCSSPRLIAAYHVFHRLLAPRHPPYALSSLTEYSVSFLVLGESVDRPCAHEIRDLVQQGRDTRFADLRLSKNITGTTLTPGGWSGFKHLSRLVEITGIEPVTSGLQSRRSPN